jgi:UDP-glucose 4-epimerase
LDRFSDYYDPELKRANLAGFESDPGFTLVEESLLDADLASLLDGVSVVYHLAAQPGVRASWGREFSVYVDDNVLSTQRLLEAAREHDLDRLVLASSSSIYGDAESFPTTEDATPAPVSPYGVTKLASEHLSRLYARGYGVPAVALRYFTVFGPRQRPDMAFNRFIRAAQQGEAIQVYGDGLQERDFTFVSDVVAATIAAAAKGEPGGVYNIAGGTSATVLDVVQILSGLLDAEVKVDHQPAVVGDARKTGADTTRARADLGYAPEVSLEDGLARQLDSLRPSAPGA